MTPSSARPWLSIATISYVLTCSVVFAYALIGILVRPAMFSDSGWGFLVWDSMRRGASFNYVVWPDSADISKDTTSFMTVWSPGQYLFPGLLEKFGASLGLAIVLVTTVFSILGLVGWHALYRAFGFPLRTVAVAVAVIACNRFFSLPFGIYNGGEVLLFGVAPWFVLLVWRFRDIRWSMVPLVFAGIFTVSFAKLSGVIFASATIVGAIFSPNQPWFGRKMIRNVSAAGAAIGIFGLLFYYAWLSKGWTAASSGSELYWSRLLTHTAFAITALWTSSLSIGDLASYVFMNPSREVLQGLDVFYYALFPVTSALFVLLFRRLMKEYADYLRFILITAVAFILAMTSIYVRGGAVSLEERHFRPVALLILVGMIHVFLNFPSWRARAVFASIMGTVAIYGITSYAVHTAADLRRPLGGRGFRHGIATQAALDFIKTIDIAASDGSRPLLLVTSPEIGLEPRNARIISNHADFQSADELRGEVHGRVFRIYILVQTRLIANGKADIILRSFVDYPVDGWEKISLGDFSCFVQ
jgi:hypothetical protein